MRAGSSLCWGACYSRCPGPTPQLLELTLGVAPENLNVRQVLQVKPLSAAPCTQLMGSESEGPKYTRLVPSDHTQAGRNGASPHDPTVQCPLTALPAELRLPVTRRLGQASAAAARLHRRTQ